MPVKRQVWCVPIGSADAGAPVGFFISQVTMLLLGRATAQSYLSVI